MAGANTKCTPELTLEFCKLILKGVRPTTACSLVEISFDSYHDWMQTTNDRPACVAFRGSVIKARAKYKASLEARFTTVAKTSNDFRAISGLLERSYPEEWASPTHRIETKNSTNVAVTVTQNLSNLSFTDLESLKQLIMKASSTDTTQVLIGDGDETNTSDDLPIIDVEFEDEQQPQEPFEVATKADEQTLKDKTDAARQVMLGVLNISE